MHVSIFYRFGDSINIIYQNTANTTDIVHIGATWRIRLNPCFHRLTQVHNANGRSIGSAVFAQLTAKCRRVHWHRLANTIEIVHIGATWRIRLNSRFLRLTRDHNPNGKSIGSIVAAQRTAESPYTLQWATLSPQISYGGSGPHLTCVTCCMRVCSENMLCLG